MYPVIPTQEIKLLKILVYSYIYKSIDQRLLYIKKTLQTFTKTYFTLLHEAPTSNKVNISLNWALQSIARKEIQKTKLAP